MGFGAIQTWVTHNVSLCSLNIEVSSLFAVTIWSTLDGMDAAAGCLPSNSLPQNEVFKQVGEKLLLIIQKDL